ncbi:MAG: hypothetical protein CL678_04390 [Bdellovibrionaceae bacterium]|nr:hypothetical protein [Pseudobdellovibrionaceae bacterium]
MITFIFALYSCFIAYSAEIGVAAPDSPEKTVSSPVIQKQVSDEEEVIEKALLGIRDPFSVPESISSVRVKTELEKFPVHKFKMLGVMTGPKKVKALVLAPNGKTYFVQSGDLIGNRKGKIVRINSNSIQIVEKIINVFGKEQDSQAEIVLPNENPSVGLRSP